MGSVAKMAADPQASVLEVLSKNAYSPFELMEQLEEKKQLSDASVKAAILDLLRQMKIEYGPDQKLHLRPECEAVR